MLSAQRSTKSSQAAFFLDTERFQRREAVKFNRTVGGGVSTGGEPVNTVTHSEVQRQLVLVVFVQNIRAVAGGAPESPIRLRLFST